MSFSLSQIERDRLEKENEERKKRKVEHFHVSGLGSCKRKQIYKIINEEVTNPIDTRVLGTFRIGDAIHEAIESDMEKEGVLFAKEKSMFVEKYNLSGRLDLILEKNGHKILYDIKTKHLFWFNRFDRGEPMVERREKMQVSAYAIFGEDKIDEVRLIYISKNDFRLVEIPVDPDIYKKEIIEELTELNKHHKENTIPDRLPEETEEQPGKPNWECSYCEYRDLCRGKDWLSGAKKRLSQSFPKLELIDAEHERKKKHEEWLKERNKGRQNK